MKKWGARDLSNYFTEGSFLIQKGNRIMLLNSNATFNAMEKLDSYGVLASKASTVCLNMNPLHGPKG